MEVVECLSGEGWIVVVVIGAAKGKGREREQGAEKGGGD